VRWASSIEAIINLFCKNGVGGGKARHKRNDEHQKAKWRNHGEIPLKTTAGDSKSMEEMAI
jgi:hypothetical protein